jgi:hypothetical protein
VKLLGARAWHYLRHCSLYDNQPQLLVQQEASKKIAAEFNFPRLSHHTLYFLHLPQIGIVGNVMPVSRKDRSMKTLFWVWFSVACIAWDTEVTLLTRG